MMGITRIICVIFVGVLLMRSSNAKDDPYEHAVELLSKHPLIDGYLQHVSRGPGGNTATCTIDSICYLCLYSIVS